MGPPVTEGMGVAMPARVVGVWPRGDGVGSANALRRMNAAVVMALACGKYARIYDADAPQAGYQHARCSVTAWPLLPRGPVLSRLLPSQSLSPPPSLLSCPFFQKARTPERPNAREPEFGSTSASTQYRGSICDIAHPPLLTVRLQAPNPCTCPTYKPMRAEDACLAIHTPASNLHPVQMSQGCPSLLPYLPPCLPVSPPSRCFRPCLFPSVLVSLGCVPFAPSLCLLRPR